MRIRSWMGIALAFGYALVFAGAYGWYVWHQDQWFADLPVVTVAMPFLFVARFASGGEYSFSGDMVGAVIEAAAFCLGLAYVIGWLVETVLRGLWRLASR